MHPALPRVAALLAAACALAAPATAAAQCEPEHPWGLADAAQAAEVVRLVNEHRQSMGLEPLAISRSLTRSAIWKSRHMYSQRYFEHDDQAPPVDRTPHERARACGYPMDIGENIAFNYFTPESVMQGWLSSPGHRQNIEHPDYRAIGVGESGLYWTQNFGFVADEPNVPPTARDDSPGAVEDAGAQRLDVLANDEDEDLDWAYVYEVQPASNGTVAKDDLARAVTYTPNPDFAGRDSFTYTMIDLGGERSSATVAVNVAGANDAPQAVADVARLKRRTKRAVIAAAGNDTDIDGDRLRVTKIVEAPKRGSAKARKGRIVYRPKRGRVRRDALVYRVSDGHGGRATARVKIRPKG